MREINRTLRILCGYSPTGLEYCIILVLFVVTFPLVLLCDVADWITRKFAQFLFIYCKEKGKKK